MIEYALMRVIEGMKANELDWRMVGEDRLEITLRPEITGMPLEVNAVLERKINGDERPHYTFILGEQMEEGGMVGGLGKVLFSRYNK